MPLWKRRLQSPSSSAPHPFLPAGPSCSQPSACALLRPGKFCSRSRGLLFFFLKKTLFSVHIHLFIYWSYSLWDLSYPTRDHILPSLRCKCGFLTLGPPGKRQSGVQALLTAGAWRVNGGSLETQARILEWFATSFSRGSSWLRDRTHDSWTGRQITYHEPPGKPWKESHAYTNNEHGCVPAGSSLLGVNRHS